jgi:hypothetical protein
LSDLGVARRKHDHRHLRPGSQITDEIDAVTVGQTEIEHHQVGAAGAGLDQAALHAVGLEDLKPFAFKRQFDEAADVGFILDDDNASGPSWRAVCSWS